MATAAGTIRGSRELPNWAASSTRVARNRLPPASIPYPAVCDQQVVIGASRLAQAVLDLRQAVDDVGRQRGVWQLHGDWGAQSDSLGGGAPAPAANQPSARQAQEHPHDMCKAA